MGLKVTPDILCVCMFFIFYFKKGRGFGNFGSILIRIHMLHDTELRNKNNYFILLSFISSNSYSFF
jgi:hypothetical protein